MASFDVDSITYLPFPPMSGGPSKAYIRRGRYKGHDVIVKQTNLEYYEREIAAYAHIGDHPNLVRLIGASKSPIPTLVMEYVVGGTLHDLVHDPYQDVTPRLMLTIALDIAEGMAHLHKIVESSPGGIMHGCLSSQNVLVASLSCRSDMVRVKLCDFGEPLGPSMGPSAPEMHYQYIAPELFDGHAPSRASDVYAFGIILWELVYRLSPYGDIPHHMLPSAVSSGTRPSIDSTLPPQLARLVEMCWSTNPSQRASFYNNDSDNTNNSDNSNNNALSFSTISDTLRGALLYTMSSSLPITPSDSLFVGVALQGQVDHVTDQAIVDLAAWGPLLIDVNVAGCTQLTDAAIIHLAQNCPDLANVDVSNCPNLSDESITALIEHCPQLQTVNIDNCTTLTDTAVAGVRRLNEDFVPVQSSRQNQIDTITEGMVAIQLEIDKTRKEHDLRHVERHKHKKQVTTKAGVTTELERKVDWTVLTREQSQRVIFKLLLLYNKKGGVITPEEVQELEEEERQLNVKEHSERTSAMKDLEVRVAAVTAEMATHERRRVQQLQDQLRLMEFKLHSVQTGQDSQDNVDMYSVLWAQFEAYSSEELRLHKAYDDAVVWQKSERDKLNQVLQQIINSKGDATSTTTTTTASTASTSSSSSSNHNAPSAEPSSSSEGNQSNPPPPPPPPAPGSSGPSSSSSSSSAPTPSKTIDAPFDLKKELFGDIEHLQPEEQSLVELVSSHISRLEGLLSKRLREVMHETKVKQTVLEALESKVERYHVITDVIEELSKMDSLDKLHATFMSALARGGLGANGAGGGAAAAVRVRDAETLKAEIGRLQVILFDEKSTEKEIDDANIKLEKAMQEYKLTAEYLEAEDKKRREQETLNREALQRVKAALQVMPPDVFDQKMNTTQELRLLTLTPEAMMKLHQNDYKQYMAKNLTQDELRAIAIVMPKFRVDQTVQRRWVESVEARIEELVANAGKPPPKPVMKKPAKPLLKLKRAAMTAAPGDLFAELLARKNKAAGGGGKSGSGGKPGSGGTGGMATKDEDAGGPMPLRSLQRTVSQKRSFVQPTSSPMNASPTLNVPRLSSPSLMPLTPSSRIMPSSIPGAPHPIQGSSSTSSGSLSSQSLQPPPPAGGPPPPPKFPLGAPPPPPPPLGSSAGVSPLVRVDTPIASTSSYTPASLIHRVPSAPHVPASPAAAVAAPPPLLPHHYPPQPQPHYLVPALPNNDDVYVPPPIPDQAVVTNAQMQLKVLLYQLGRDIFNGTPDSEVVMKVKQVLEQVKILSPAFPDLASLAGPLLRNTKEALMDRSGSGDELAAARRKFMFFTEEARRAANNPQ